jgi:hypothetical protein
MDDPDDVQGSQSPMDLQSFYPPLDPFEGSPWGGQAGLAVRVLTIY